MISTDGVGVSVLFLREDLVGKRLPSVKKGVSRELYSRKTTLNLIGGVRGTFGSLIWFPDERI